MQVVDAGVHLVDAAPEVAVVCSVVELHPVDQPDHGQRRGDGPAERSGVLRIVPALRNIGSIVQVDVVDGHASVDCDRQALQARDHLDVGRETATAGTAVHMMWCTAR